MDISTSKSGTTTGSSGRSVCLVDRRLEECTMHERAPRLKAYVPGQEFIPMLASSHCEVAQSCRSAKADKRWFPSIGLCGDHPTKPLIHRAPVLDFTCKSFWRANQIVRLCLGNFPCQRVLDIASRTGWKFDQYCRIGGGVWAACSPLPLCIS